MDNEKNKKSNEDEEVLGKKGLIKIDLQKMYSFESKDIVPDITIARYSNFAYIQTTPRDVYIDFLEMPGIKKDGKVLANGTRIYMSHVAAQRLGEALLGVLEQIHSRGEMELYVGKQKKGKAEKESS